MFSSTWWKDTLERAVATFAEAALGIWILADGADVFNVSVLEGAASAGLIAGLAVVKGAIAANIGERNSASLSPDLATIDTSKAPNYPPQV